MAACYFSFYEEMLRIRNYVQAVRILGLPIGFDPGNDDSFAKAMAVWKELTVEARREGKDERAADLSLCKSLIQARHTACKSKKCPKCGKAKSAKSKLCQMCNQASHYDHTLDEKNPMEPKLHEIETILVPIPETGGITFRAFKKLAEGHIGDSFLTTHANTNCQYLAKLLGGQIICRCVESTDDKKSKHRYYRVWRSDGKTLDEVNEIIRKRMTGEKIEKPPPWVTPSKEVLEELRAKKAGEKGKSKEKTGASKEAPDDET